MDIGKHDGGSKLSKNKTIVIDAGIATEENIKMLAASNYHYIAVNRGNTPFGKDFSDMQVIKEDIFNGIKIEVKRFTHNNETYILCKSKKKKGKETGIRKRFEKILLEKLKYLKDGLLKPRRTKNYNKLVENIGRLKQRYSKAAMLYNIEVIPEKKQNIPLSKLKATNIIWKKKDDLYTKKIENEGAYVLRTSRSDLSNKEIWKTYIMLTRIEEAFKTMKSSLGLRPIFHQLENRSDAHLFISVLAYHILHIIECRLRENGDDRSWSVVRDIMKTHERGTISFLVKSHNGQSVYNFIRLNSKMEEEHTQIYKKLNISTKSLPPKKYIQEQM